MGTQQQIYPFLEIELNYVILLTRTFFLFSRKRFQTRYRCAWGTTYVFIFERKKKEIQKLK